MESGSRTITEVQREAISEAMRLLVEEDHERGLDDTTEFGCPACSRRMPLAGSVLYDDIRLCNGCATAYELARIGGGLRSCAEYVSSRPHALRASAND
ncbi:MAG TPA: hypothetical protein VIB47_04835 [Dehalococcoidia bacterium]